MPENGRPVAFVAMKFEGDHWREKRYLAIHEELEHAGFKCLRADQIRTSGPVVEEVCRLLRDAELVVIDSTGDSHSVSYELGYCHGADRLAETTLLLRADAEDLPFNYRHYRHRVYRDLRHLRRLVRDFLDILEPLKAGQCGYAFTFTFESGATGYISEGASCIFRALEELKFSGRCECYSGEQPQALGKFFTVGIVLRKSARGAKPTYPWWMKLQKLVEASALRSGANVHLVQEMSEMAEKGAMVASFPLTGVAEFAEGKVSRILGAQESSLFLDHVKHKQPSS